MSESVLARAKREFLTGTAFSSPDQAISSGLKTVEEWSLCLDHCRDEAAALKNPPQPLKKTSSRPRNTRA
ncbi:hypothetical protein [Deinococcus cellulosilyticus]|uniref:Uncharacterized protein n=1 Tax=Deinococcus cellulosilyticus (strain DSM 18568 / NBRC 106333 / KACC 11606 / 5516J-15) TaxID=1223518 RepID=A0A511NBG3_DEIC1|nr:hypothetical protein [Deinococcus cellulosilyticus]GEM49906.1 hypothetical protein DC3_55410 [Deinococcus cellulosilyticus NBRC 106333 = KACC 11606]